MPQIEADLPKFADANFITEIDITRTYYQIPLSPDSRKYTACCTSKGLMEYTHLPFGLETSCATYIRLMRKILADMDQLYNKFISVYFDNIYVATQSFDEHLEALNELFLCLRRYNLTARPTKCTFASESVNYLGFVVGKVAFALSQAKLNRL